MANQPAVQEPSAAAIMEKVVIEGDLSKLSPAERLVYYSKVCESLGLNPLTRPFDYLRLSGKLTLYAKKDATDQLAKRHGISVDIVSQETQSGVYFVHAKASTPDRYTSDFGAVPIANLGGEALANAMMKAVTKAKRRSILSLIGLGWLDETEVESIQGAKVVSVDPGTGEIVDQPALPQGEAPKMAPLARLQARVADEGLEWVEFLDILGVSGWDQWLAQGETPGSAWAAYEEYREGRAAPAEDEADASRAEGDRVLDEEVGPSAGQQAPMDNLDDLFPPSGDGH